MPPEARVSIWMFEWYRKQAAGTPGLDQFIAEIRKRSGGKVPTARTWFGYVTIHAYALACEKAKSIEAKAVARALADMELPPDIKLQPNKVYFRGGDHQLMLSAFIGELHTEGRRRSGKSVQGEQYCARRQHRSCRWRIPAAR